MARRFRFRLETLLKVRGLHEREAQRKLARARAELARLDALDRQTGAEITRQQAALLEVQRQSAVDPLVLQRGRAWTAHLRRTLLHRNVERDKRLRELAQLDAQWREARKQVRVLETLKERRREEYDRARRRREQAETDTLARQLHALAHEDEYLRSE